jgi:hypothetical protein
MRTGTLNLELENMRKTSPPPHAWNPDEEDEDITNDKQLVQVAKSLHSLKQRMYLALDEELNNSTESADALTTYAPNTTVITTPPNNNKKSLAGASQVELVYDDDDFDAAFLLNNTFESGNQTNATSKKSKRTTSGSGSRERRKRELTKNDVMASYYETTVKQRMSDIVRLKEIQQEKIQREIREMEKQKQEHKISCFEDFFHLPILEGITADPQPVEEESEEIREKIRRKQQLKMRKMKLVDRQIRSQEMYHNALQRKENASEKMRSSLFESQKLMAGSNSLLDQRNKQESRKTTSRTSDQSNKSNKDESTESKRSFFMTQTNDEEEEEEEEQIPNVLFMRAKSPVDMKRVQPVITRKIHHYPQSPKKLKKRKKPFEEQPRPKSDQYNLLYYAVDTRHRSSFKHETGWDGSVNLRQYIQSVNKHRKNTTAPSE